MIRESEADPHAKEFWLSAFAPLAVAVLAFLVYYPTLNFAWTDTDDINLIREDSAFLTQSGSVTQAFSRPFFPGAGEEKSYYRPLVTASFLFDAGTKSPPEPAPFHRTNALLHACAAALVYALAMCFTTRRLLGAAAAVGFALHPATVQSVAWVPGRSDSLMAVCAFAALLAYIRYDRSNSRRWLAAHLTLFAAALYAKESAIAIVPIAATYSLWISRQRSRLKYPMLSLGWLAAVTVWLLARNSALGSGASGAHFSSVFHNVPMLWISLGKLFWPADLQVLATLQDSARWPGAVAILVLGLVLCFTRAAMRPTLLWATLLIPAFMLAPALLVDNELVLDNRLYVPLAGVMVGALVFVDSFVVTARAKKVVPVAAAIIAVGLASSTVSYSRAFESPRAFCEAAVRGSPHLPLAHLNMGSMEFRAGNLDGAEERFRRALELDPRWPVAHNNLGLVFMNRGKWAEAEQQFEAELANNPNYSKAHFNLGLVLAHAGREREAVTHFERVVALVPSDVSAWGEMLKYFGPRESARATQIMNTMQALGVQFHSPDGK